MIKKVIKAAGLVVGILLLLLLEDTLLWLAPGAAANLTDSWRTRQFRLRCAEVKIGMTRERAFELLRPATPVTPGPNLAAPSSEAGQQWAFVGARGGVCMVQFDPAGQTVTGTRYVPPGEIY